MSGGLDPDTGEIIDANHAASNFYGHEKPELTQMKITDINTMSKEQVFEEMEKAKTKSLSGVLPICASCKKYEMIGASGIKSKIIFVPILRRILHMVFALNALQTFVLIWKIGVEDNSFGHSSRRTVT